MHVRPIRPDDAERLVRLPRAPVAREHLLPLLLAPAHVCRAAEVEHFTHVDYVDRMAFVGIVGDELVGVARYDRYRARSDAEVAFFIDDAHHGRGIATVLLEYLAVAAREAGISGFTAAVLPENRRMLGVFTQAGFEVTSRFEEGIIEVELAIDPTPEALAAIEERAKIGRGPVGRAAAAPALGRRDRRVAAPRARSATRCSAICSSRASTGRCTR